MPCEICGGIVKKQNTICCYCKLAQERAEQRAKRETKKLFNAEMAKEARKGYFKKYYEKNKEALCLYARERYNITRGEYSRRLATIEADPIANQE